MAAPATVILIDGPRVSNFCRALASSCRAEPGRGSAQELVVVPVHHLYQDVEVPGGWGMGRHGTGGSIFAYIEDISDMLVELGSGMSFPAAASRPDPPSVEPKDVVFDQLHKLAALRDLWRRVFTPPLTDSIQAKRGDAAVVW